MKPFSPFLPEDAWKQANVDRAVKTIIKQQNIKTQLLINKTICHIIEGTEHTKVKNQEEKSLGK